jgi:hypothetical protein
MALRWAPSVSSISYLFEDDRQLDGAESLAVDARRQRQTEIAHLGQACPCGRLVASRVVLQRAATLFEGILAAQEVTGGLTQQRLVF